MKGRKPTLDNVVPMRGDAPKPVPEPHDLMSDGAKKVWQELAPELVRMDRLKPHYEHMFVAYCESASDVIELTSNIVLEGRTYTVKTRNGVQQKKTANWQARQDALANMRQLGALFGLSPVDDARLATGGQGDLFEELLRGIRGGN
ncbi:P27 family phage terminase small subunit [Salipiger thiooxidans]|jgi:P27 family predicted phage terminase small subunit|uniref:P27 family phage terminase small subunit n=1 Tax=Salipiger thiooxidans TaxID=282683 RepID=UPI001CFAEB3E|nr:P27 family phage terminase small subunit [Salipiger thiooxidans]